MKQTRFLTTLLCILLLVSLCLTGCDAIAEYLPPQFTQNGGSVDLPSTALPFDYASIPEYTGDAYVSVGEGVPFFTEADLTVEAFETYSPLDHLGRCGVAYANICLELMPTEERGSIGSVKPSGWVSVKYDIVDGKYLFNRCHLIGHQLAGEDANNRNLITGTRYLNIEGMLPFENMIADYVKETSNHVLFRVTPVFLADELVARGVLMEAYSVEDKGAGISFCVYAYNVQPGITIDYTDGSSNLSGTTPSPAVTTQASSSEEEAVLDYVVNINTLKFHKPTCASAKSIASSNRLDTKATRSFLLEQGYSPCGSCKP